MNDDVVLSAEITSVSLLIAVRVRVCLRTLIQFSFQINSYRIKGSAGFLQMSRDDRSPVADIAVFL